MNVKLIRQIDTLLPQTQCGKCGHPGCKPYAEGIARGEPINRCPPGGEETLGALAELLDVPLLPLDHSRGVGVAQVAYIREAECIGCTKCLQVCPVDAIVGAAKLMHTVLVDECTGCDLCLAPCPVDCIDLVPLTGSTPMVGGSAPTHAEWEAREQRRQRARSRFEHRNLRLHRDEARKRAERAARASRPAPHAPAAVIAHDPAIQQAKAAVAMGRAQLTRSRKAFGATPSAQQLAVLANLEHALSAAEQRLGALQAAPGPATAPLPASTHAKVQLAMAKAQLARLERTSGTSAEQLEHARQIVAALAHTRAP